MAVRNAGITMPDKLIGECAGGWLPVLLDVAHLHPLPTSSHFVHSQSKMQWINVPNHGS